METPIEPLTHARGMKKVLIVTGEPSGDLQAGLLVSQLKALDTTLEVFAVGGERLKAAGAEIIHDIKDLSVLGFFDVLKNLDKFKKLMRLVLDKIEELKPDAVIFVDFSGFNLRLAKRIHTLTKTIYYISPQVWASRQGRVKTIKECIDKMIVIFKFEREFYRRFGIDAEFVGHPLLDIVKPTLSRQEALQAFGLKENCPVFALLPGSRASEINNILPIMLQSARLIKEKIPNAQFIISKPSSLDTTLYEKIIQSSLPGLRGEAEAGRSNLNLEIKIIEGKQYDCLNVADFVLVSSGTATLETAIMEKPNVVIYKMSALNYMLYRPLVRVPYIGMENIVAGKCIAPEFIQFKAKPEAIAKKVLEILSDTQRLDELKREFTALRENLGEPGAPLRAAKSILDFVKAKPRNEA
ncbi:MAG TPA: lipid-A-disaccharide synthase [Candidatus Omnitrophica bacterium]|nr:lipid-A-disaccharide synthase [Candidatus Omnitrophota bacterium]HBG63422.1 lipid-A-disaccharide synthase [Candidatus Omnitrophota bacterium]HCD38193.1 lipid-A-disaccharide synthase [Candidatus Omnitrophota bacterium]